MVDWLRRTLLWLAREPETIIHPAPSGVLGRLKSVTFDKPSERSRVLGLLRTFDPEDEVVLRWSNADLVTTCAEAIEILTTNEQEDQSADEG